MENKQKRTEWDESTDYLTPEERKKAENAIGKKIIKEIENALDIFYKNANIYKRSFLYVISNFIVLYKLILLIPLYKFINSLL